MKFTLTVNTDSTTNWFRNRMKMPGDMFPPDKPLLSLPIVYWMCGLLFMIILFTTVSVIWKSWPVHLDLSSDGYAEFAKKFQASIAMFLFSIPALALIASNHRSVQTMRQMSLTSHQIELATGQNRFANYYKHVEEFIKWCEHTKGIGAVKSRRKLHRVLFPDARDGDFGLSKDFLREFTLFLNAFHMNVDHYSKSREASYLVDRQVRDFAEKYWLTLPPESEADFSYDTDLGKVRLPSDGLRGFVKARFDFIKAVDELLSFDPEYISSDIVRAVGGFNTNALPILPGESEPFTLFGGYQR